METKRVETPRTRRINIPPSSRTLNPAEDTDKRTVRLPESSATSDDPAPAPDRRLDDLYSLYAIQSKIGDGGMGVVYLAKDRRLGRFVAIKRLNHQAQEIASLRSRFLHEARAVAVLNHIHIVHIYALGEDSEGPYIVMEYVPGPADAAGSHPPGRSHPNPPVSLDEHVSRNGQYTVNEAIDLLVKISRAIAYAHDCGVIHRDLKPGNILLDETGEPKIVDFGLARLAREEESKLTVPGEKLLSLGYGAPEQESDASVSDERADIYGLGALLYFAITGQNPRYFREQDIPVALRDVLVKALATDREQRWANATEYLEALRAVQSRTRVETPTAKTTWRCKWCDTINPLTIRFCSECGWDGSETCPECGTETFVGMQYCGKCGADVRAYEGAEILLRRMRSAMEATEFERVGSLAARSQGFEPAGPSGRTLARKIQEVRDEAVKHISRRDQLHELIPLEVRAQNYERARDFIKELRRLSGNQQLFADVEAELPGLQLKRDLKRAARAMHAGEGRFALQLCDTLLNDVAPDHPECIAMRRAILRRQALRHGARGIMIAAGLALLYLLSLPPLIRLAGAPLPRGLQLAYQPAIFCYQVNGWRKPLQTYANLWQTAPLDNGVARTNAVMAAMDQNVPPPELVDFQTNYTHHIETLEQEHRSFGELWPTQYLAELETLMERRRSVGDFDGWNALNQERQQFSETRVIGPTTPEVGTELATLQQKYRNMVSSARAELARRIVGSSKKFVNDLTDLQRDFTKNGRMEDAARVNHVIRTVRSSPEVQSAEALLAELGPSTDTDGTPPLPVPPSDGLLGDLQPLRQQYEEKATALENAFLKNMEEWPETYLNALRKMLDAYQEAGEYEAWQAVNNEIERFEIDRVLHPEHVVAEPTGLKELQRKQITLLSDFRIKRARAIVELADKQIGILSEMQRRRTIAGDMETAGRINDEIRRVRNATDVLAAQAELAPPATMTNQPPSTVVSP